MVKRKFTNLINFNIHILLLIGVVLMAVRSFFAGGFVPTHDGEYHIIRLWQFDKVFMSGVLFPRWAPDLNNGYGVPIFSFFYPLPNYVGELFHLMGFSFISSVQLVLASGLAFSSLTMYLLLRLFVGKWQATTGAIFYLLAPYHLVDVFVRGSVGEVWALAIVPLVLFFTTRIIWSKAVNKFDQLFLPISIALLLTSHNILGIMFYTIGFLYGIILMCVFKKGQLRILLRNYLSGFLLTGFFWIPIIVESKYVTGLDIVNAYDHFVDLFQLIIPSWGTGFSVAGVGDQISFQIGIPHMIVLLLAVALNLKEGNRFIWWLIVVSVIVSICMMDIAAPLWRAIPILSYFQFPWRILSFIVLTTSVFASFVARYKPRIMVPLCIVLVLLFYLPYTKASVYQKRADSFYLTNNSWTEGTATLGNTFNTKWFSQGKSPSSKPFTFDESVIQLIPVIVKPNMYAFTVIARESSVIDIHHAFFPGWTAQVDQRSVGIAEHGGLMQLTVPAGKHSIIVRFAQSLAVLVGSLISFITFSTMLWLFFRHYENCH